MSTLSDREEAVRRVLVLRERQREARREAKRVAKAKRQT
jgi:hypothetical protein